MSKKSHKSASLILFFDFLRQCEEHLGIYSLIVVVIVNTKSISLIFLVIELFQY